jgi:hypothetical protein
LAASVAEYDAALQACDAATSRLKSAERRLFAARKHLLAWCELADVTSRGNFGWEPRFTSFVAAIARPDAPSDAPATATNAEGAS